MTNKQLKETITHACTLDSTLPDRLRALLWFDPKWGKMNCVELTALHLAYQILTDPVIATTAAKALKELKLLNWWRSQATKVLLTPPPEFSEVAAVEQNA